MPATLPFPRLSSSFDFLLNGAPSFTRPVKAHPLLLFFLDKYNVPFYAAASSTKSLLAFFLLNILPFAWIFFSLGIGRKFYGDMTGLVGKSAEEANIDRSLTFDDVAGGWIRKSGGGGGGFVRGRTRNSGGQIGSFKGGGRE